MPMKELKIFENPQFGEIRTSGTSDEPMFCLSDVCKALGLGNVTEVKKRLSPPFISTIEVGVRTGKKSDGSPAIQQTQMIFIGEPNLYKCIFQSRKKEAEAFQEELPEKPVTMAIKEVAAGELTAGLKEEYKN